ncbi:MAG: hypothetical protein H6920_05815 [Sphingomonadaceae bacterium]|nr:hypothetical protein [Sphingomonadaceae bacterium]
MVKGFCQQGLGRINRSFPEHKALAGIDVSDEIALAISDGLITNKIGIMPEVGAAILRTRSPKDFSFAHVVRRLAAYPESESCARLPLFSLWSFDRMAPLDKPLIEQMANSDARRTLDISSEIAKSLVDFFFEAWNSLGYIYEINAQNVLVEIDSRLILRRVILRDFNSTEKDLARRAEISRPTTFRSGNYKVLDINDLDTLHIRRSFAFDFKFCNYVVSPLLEALARVDQTLAEEFLGSVRDHVADALGRMPVEFFHPNGTWWAHPEMELTDSRPYVQFSNPMLR